MAENRNAWAASLLSKRLPNCVPSWKSSNARAATRNFTNYRYRFPSPHVAAPGRPGVMEASTPK